MTNHKVGSSYSFGQLASSYKADPQRETDAHYLLYKGDEILALVLRHKYNPEPLEVWIGNETEVAAWGKKLAELKGKKPVPVYLSPPSRKFYEFKGYRFVTGDTDKPEDLAKRKGPVPLSRVVFIHPVQTTPTR